MLIRQRADSQRRHITEGYLGGIIFFYDHEFIRNHFLSKVCDTESTMP